MRTVTGKTRNVGDAVYVAVNRTVYDAVYAALNDVVEIVVSNAVE